VGDGNSIVIWTNKWLNDPTSLRVLSQPNTIFAQAKVSVLLDPKTCAWCEELVCQIFILTNVQSILGILLNIRLPNDRPLWAFIPKGQFIVHSAYKLAVVENWVECMVAASNVDIHKKFWRRLWGLNLPNKIKSFS